MEQSPLVLQSRPDTFEQKIVQLYRGLLQNPDEDDRSEGYWSEFFLLKPDTARLQALLDSLAADYLIHISHVSQELLQRCVSTLRDAQAPSDEHALQTMSVLLDAVFAKRYQSPSADIIEVLAGLDNVDHVFQDVVTVLQRTIGDGRTESIRVQAVKTMLSITSGAFHTSLLTYFTHQDLFPALMDVIVDSDPESAILALILCGVLANANKFEIYNPYQGRIAQLADQSTLDKIAVAISTICVWLRDNYAVLQDDSAQSWSIGSTFSYVSGALSGKKVAAPVLTEEEARSKFAALPHPEAAFLLSLYEFVVHNKPLPLRLIEGSSTSPASSAALCELCSFTTYLLQHAHRSSRAALYSHMALLILRIILEEPANVKALCDSVGNARMCRQRPPTLPMVSKPRPMAAIIIDVAVDAINHNLRTNLDVSLYTLAQGILIRLLSQLHQTRTRLAYHWNELWRCLLSFVRFCSQYQPNLRNIDGANSVVYDTVNIITLCLTRGESFLPDSAAVDDLFYKVIESHKDLTTLSERWELASSPVSPNIQMLINAGSHLTEALGKTNGKSKSVTTRDVMRVIQEGSDSLSMDAKEGTDHWVAYREQEYKAEIKRITRIAVADGKRIAGGTNEA